MALRVFAIIFIVTVALLGIEGKWDISKSWPQFKCHREYRRNPTSYGNEGNEYCNGDPEVKNSELCTKLCILFETGAISSEDAKVGAGAGKPFYIFEKDGTTEWVLQEFGKWNYRHELKHTSEKGIKKATELTDKLMTICDPIMRKIEYKSGFHADEKHCATLKPAFECIDNVVKCE